MAHAITLPPSLPSSLCHWAYDGQYWFWLLCECLVLPWESVYRLLWFVPRNVTPLLCFAFTLFAAGKRIESGSTVSLSELIVLVCDSARVCFWSCLLCASVYALPSLWKPPPLHCTNSQLFTCPAHSHTSYWSAGQGFLQQRGCGIFHPSLEGSNRRPIVGRLIIICMVIILLPNKILFYFLLP